MRWTLLLAAVMALGCDAPSTRETTTDTTPRAASTPAHHFEVDSAAYTLRRDGDGLTASIGWIFRNPVADTIQVVHCNGHIIMDLQMRTAEGWDYVWRAMTNGCLSAPIEIAPGDSLSGRMEVWGAEPGHPNLPTFTTADLDGEFRLVWHQPRTDFTMDPTQFGAP